MFQPDFDSPITCVMKAYEYGKRYGKKKGNSVSSSSIAEEISRIGMYSTGIAELTLDIYTFRNESVRI